MITPAPIPPRRAPVPPSPRARRAPASDAPHAIATATATATPIQKPAARPARATTPRAATPRPAAARAHTPRSTATDLAWPASFDDWMIDIVRRRALRLNSGARRRGASGTVRAVELGHILEKSKDARGRWLCCICHAPVTLADLSFDHILALADGGEHAAENLMPAHRKCNEIKGSEKAQYRVQAVERWLTEWADSHNGAQPRGAARHHAPVPAPYATERHYA